MPGARYARVAIADTPTPGGRKAPRGPTDIGMDCQSPTQPGNGSWATCRPRALTRRHRCHMLVRRVRGPGLQNQRPHPQGEALDFNPRAHDPWWEAYS